MPKKERRMILLLLLFLVIVIIIVVINKNSMRKGQNVSNQNLVIANEEESISFESQTLTEEDKIDITAHLGETITIDVNTEK